MKTMLKTLILSLSIASPALALVPMLARRELEAVASDARLLLPLRRRAQLLSGAAAGPGGAAGDRRD